MEQSERDTVINLNQADMAEGYFAVWTCEPAVFRRLCLRIGGRDKLLGCRVGMRDGREGSWECRVPIEYWNPATFSMGVRKRKKLSPSQRKAMSERLKTIRNRKKPDTVTGDSEEAA